MPGTGPKPIDEMSSLPCLEFSDGNRIPVLGYGLGTANFKTKDFDRLDQKTIDNSVTAIKSGFYHLDGAEKYGNEEELGVAIKLAGVPREKLFVTTKTSKVAGDSVQQSFDRSMGKLGLDYVDLYLMHSPFWAKSPQELQEAWAEMEMVKESGRAKSIGVSNFLQEHVETILQTARHVPVLNQIEYHPYLQHGELLSWLQGKQIIVQAYSALTAITAASPGPCDMIYQRLAAKYGVERGEIAMRWCLDQGVAVVTTSSNEERLKGILQNVPSFKLKAEEIDEISLAGTGKHFRAFWTAHFAADDKR